MSTSLRRSSSWRRSSRITGTLVCGDPAHYLHAYPLDSLASHAPHLGLAAAREAAAKKIQDVKFEPKNTELGEPKEGEHDDKEHHGGNKWAGGVRASVTSFAV